MCIAIVCKPDCDALIARYLGFDLCHTVFFFAKLNFLIFSSSASVLNLPLAKTQWSSVSKWNASTEISSINAFILGAVYFPDVPMNVSCYIV